MLEVDPKVEHEQENEI